MSSVRAHLELNINCLAAALVMKQKEGRLDSPQCMESPVLLSCGNTALAPPGFRPAHSFPPIWLAYETLFVCLTSNVPKGRFHLLRPF